MDVSYLPLPHEGEHADASAAAPVASDMPLTPAAVYPPVPPIDADATIPFTDASTPAPLTGNKFEAVTPAPLAADTFETGEAPLIDMAEPELVALLQEGFAGLRRLTPRTLEACAEEGLEPIELLPRTLEDFAPRDLKVHLPRHHQEARLQRFEERRLKKLSDVVVARRRLIANPPECLTVEEQASRSVLVEERKKRAEESMRAAEKQMKMLADQLKSQEETSIAAAQRDAEARKRLATFESERQHMLQEKQAIATQKREVQYARIAHRQAEAAAEHARRQAAAAEHEARRAQRLEDERREQDRLRKEASERKKMQAEVANQEKTNLLEKRKEDIGRMIEERQMKVDTHAAKREAERLQDVKDSIERQRKNDLAVCEVDRQEQLFAEKTREKLEHVSEKGSEVRNQLLEQTRRKHAARGQAAASARIEVERQRDLAVRKLVQDGERKEQKRQSVLASRADEMSDHAEKRRAKLEDLEERVRRQARKREHELERTRESQKQQDQVFFAQKAALERLQQERLAQKHLMEAEGKVGHRVTMKDLDAQAEPGPTSYDNRFFSLGELRPSGKYGRVGSKPAPPAFSFGNLTEHSLPRVLDKSMMVELVGLSSPGPNTAHQALGSRLVLDKSSRYPRQPSWSMGQKVEDPLRKEALSKPGPGETHASDKQLSLTRYPSAPTFSFASSTYRELHAQQKKAKSRPSTAAATPERVRFDHSSRMPGPCSYDHGAVQTSLRHHRNLSDGCGVSQRFAKADRFLPLDMDMKDVMGPTTFAKQRNVPGPQKYRPQTAYLSTPLKF